MKYRMEMVEERVVDWDIDEEMEFGYLLKEGINVRLSGKDVERGNLSNRKNVMKNKEVEKEN